MREQVVDTDILGGVVRMGREKSEAPRLRISLYSHSGRDRHEIYGKLHSL